MSFSQRICEKKACFLLPVKPSRIQKAAGFYPLKGLSVEQDNVNWRSALSDIEGYVVMNDNTLSARAKL
jgi:hypothetical protein